MGPSKSLGQLEVMYFITLVTRWLGVVALDTAVSRRVGYHLHVGGTSNTHRPVALYVHAHASCIIMYMFYNMRRLVPSFFSSCTANPIRTR